MLEPGDVDRPDPRVEGQGGRGVLGEMDDQEHQDAGDDQHRDGEQKPADDVSKHSRLPPSRPR